MKSDSADNRTWYVIYTYEYNVGRIPNSILEIQTLNSLQKNYFQKKDQGGCSFKIEILGAQLTCNFC